jgi:mechanosensitive ion channel-like protein
LVAQVDLDVGWEEAWRRTISFLPKLGGFLLILIVGYFIAKAIEKILDRLLERVGFDRLVERGGVKQALARSQYDASSILSRIVFYIAFLFVLQLAFGVFGPNPISNLLEGIIAFLPRLFVGIVIVIITAAAANAVKTIIQATLGSLSYGNLLANVAMAFVWFIGIAAALNQVQIAREIVNGLFYAVLALVVGTGIVAIGGGGIQPMRERWQRALNKMDLEAPRIQQEAQAGAERAKSEVERMKESP